MRKLLKKISDWWNYTILKKSRTEIITNHTEIVTLYGKSVNKKNQIYYYKDTFTVLYVGKNEVSRTRIGRAFVNKQEFDAHSEN